MKIVWNVIETLTPPFDENVIFNTLNRFTEEQCSLLKIKYLNRKGGVSTRTVDIDSQICVEDGVLIFYQNGKRRSVKLDELMEIKGKILKGESSDSYQ